MMYLANLDPNKYMVVDAESGTVLGLNLRLVPVPADVELLRQILASDSEAIRYALVFGHSLSANID